MRVLVAPDGFTGSLTAPEAARAIADGWLAARPHDEVDLCPLSDGGPGLLDVLEAAASGGGSSSGSTGGSGGGSRRVRVPVTGPLGEPVTAALLVLDGGRTAVVESALACGTALLPRGAAADRDALAASSAGVGHLLAAARTTGARRVVVGLGGTASTDGGAGALAVLGAAGGSASRPGGHLLGGGGALGRAAAADLAADLSGLAALRRAWEGLELVVVSDVDVPLLGPTGAARGFGPQKGASPDDVVVLEAALAAWVRAVEAVDPGTRGLAARPGAGAAGGLGLALSLLGGHRVPGAVAEAVGLAERVAGADVVVTGEGCLDWQSLRGKVVARVCAAGAATGTPVLAVAGQVRLSDQERASAGLALARAVGDDAASVEASLARPGPSLSAATSEVAASWGAARA